MVRDGEFFLVVHTRQAHEGVEGERRVVLEEPRDLLDRGGGDDDEGGENPSDCSSTTASPNFPFNASKIPCASTGPVIPSRLRAEILLLHDDLLELHDPSISASGRGGQPGM